MRDGDASASDELAPLVYTELRRIAQQRLRKERQGHTLEPTALVNEVYLRICQNSSTAFQNRAHFLAFASRLMRRILVDYARARCAAKRGGAARPETLEWNVAVGGEESHLVELMDLNVAIESLSREKPSCAEVIEMRYFGGMTAEETAEAVGRSVHVVQHELRFAHAWLRRKLASTPDA